ncbi:hypothetical protein MMC07_004502 [Pseudocyphellaria aurata]|nr:hypothetical protein [Pseudocyphellaria aurata]
MSRRRGGNCPNTLEVLQQLLDISQSIPVSLALCVVLPSTSSTGTQQVKSSLGPRIDLTSCIYREEYNEAASCYILRSRDTDTRTIVNYNELPEMTSKEFSAMADELKHDMGWCHFEGRIPVVTLECVQYLRRCLPAVKISVEIENPARVGLDKLVEEADFIFYSKSWAQGNDYESPEDCLRGQAVLAPKASLLCCTWGHEGASALEMPGFNYKHTPAYTEETFHVVDTIGAGDTFTSGMLYCLLCHSDDWNLSRKLDFANELAGRKVMQEGFSGLGDRIRHAL